MVTKSRSMSCFLHNSAAMLLLILVLFETTGLGAAEKSRPHFRLFKRQSKGLALGRSADYGDGRFFPIKGQAPAPAPPPLPPCYPTTSTTYSPTTPPTDTSTYWPTDTSTYSPTTPPSSSSSSTTSPSYRAYASVDPHPDAVASSPLISTEESQSHHAIDDAQPHIDYSYGGDDFDHEDTNDDDHIAHPLIVSFAGDDHDHDDDDGEDVGEGEVGGHYNVNHHQFVRPQIYSTPMSAYMEPIDSPRQSNIQFNRQRRRDRQRVNRIRRQYRLAQRHRLIQRRQHFNSIRQQNSERRRRNRIRREHQRHRRMNLQQQRRFRRQERNSIRRHRINRNRLINLAYQRRRG